MAVPSCLAQEVYLLVDTRPVASGLSRREAIGGQGPLSLSSLLSWLPGMSAGISPMDDFLLPDDTRVLTGGGPRTKVRASRLRMSA